MNLDQIASRIAHPDSSLGSEIPALKTLTEKYPFAQVFSILYLKALSNQNDISFDEALQKHAYRVTDRMKLYDLIHSVSQPEMVETNLIESVDQFPPSEGDKGGGKNKSETIEFDPNFESFPISKNAESIENKIESVGYFPPLEGDQGGGQDESETIKIEPNLESVSENIESNNESAGIEALPESYFENNSDSLAANDISKINEIETILPLSPPPKGETQNNLPEGKEEISASEISTDFIHDELELEIISQVVATVYNDNLEHSIPEKPIEEKKSEPLITPVPESKSGNLEEKRSFSSWLKAGNQNLSATTNQAAEENKKEVKHIEKQIDKIIDQFIEKEPTISRPKKEFYSPTKKAKESVSSEGMIYTETLADIFAIQGNFPKAITAYEQLMLTNPEKKIFFAQRIKELKEKLNT